MPDDECLNIRLSDYFHSRREPLPQGDAEPRRESQPPPRPEPEPRN